MTNLTFFIYSRIQNRSYEEFVDDLECMNLFNKIKNENARVEVIEIVRIETKNKRKKNKRRRQTQVWKNFNNSSFNISLMNINNKIQIIFNENNDRMTNQKKRIIDFDDKINRIEFIMNTKLSQFQVTMNKLIDMQKKNRRYDQEMQRKYRVFNHYHTKLRINSLKFNHSIDF